MNIKETKELLTFGFDLQDAITSSLSDDKITFVDFPKFFPAIMSSAAAFGGVNLVFAEISDLDDAERGALIEFVQERFDLPNDEVEKLIEDTLFELLSIIRLALRWKDVKKS